MRKIIISLLVLASVSSCTDKVVIDRELEKEAIQSVVESMFEAIANVDTVDLKTLMYDDFFAYDMAQAMKLEDFFRVLADMSQMGFSELSFKVEPVTFYFYEKNAVACFETTGNAKMGDQDIKMEFLESYLMIKTEEGWKIQFFHSTQLPPPSQPTETE